MISGAAQRVFKRLDVGLIEVERLVIEAEAVLAAGKSVEEIATFREMGCTGTAATIVPVAHVTHGETSYDLPGAPGPVTLEAYRLLTEIQTGDIPDTRGWVRRVNDA